MMMGLRSRWMRSNQKLVVGSSSQGCWNLHDRCIFLTNCWDMEFGETVSKCELVLGQFWVVGYIASNALV